MNVCYTILLIEDSVEDRDLYKRYLQQDDDYTYEILEAETGDQALALCQDRSPDLILLDFRLPDIDGLEILSQLRRWWSPHPLPVILLTGQGNEFIAVQAMKSGAQDYLVKGRITQDTFGCAIHTVLDRLELLRQSEQQQRQLEARVEARTRELNRLKERQEFILQSGPGVVYTARAFGDFRATFIGANVQGLFGYSPEDYTTDSNFWINHIHPDDREPMLANLQHLFENGYHTHEYRFLHQDGTYRWVYDQCKLIRDGQGSPLEIIGYWTDISDRKQMENELRRSNAQLEATNQQLAQVTRLKDEFLASMSHELRTPLNAVLGLAEGVLDEVYGPLTERQRKALTTIQNSGAHLLDLINDILDLAKVEAGQMKLSLTTTSIQGLCQSSLEVVKPLADRKGIQLTSRLPAEKLFIQVDERRISQVLINLLNNAVKFTPSGGQIHLEARLEREEDRSRGLTSQILFSVTDTGIGIAEENLQKLFQSFVQIDNSLSRNHSGTGLGLALVKQLASLHGGTVNVTSQVGKGSCFTVCLPYFPGFQAANDADPETIALSFPSPATEPAFADRPLVLVAEDNEANIEALKDYLELQGCRVMIAEDGLEALAVAQKQPFQLILMDIQMPRLNGLDAIRRIRQIPDHANTPIIALTAMAMPNDRQQCLDAGANDYLSKPMNLKQLTRLIKTYLEVGNG